MPTFGRSDLTGVESYNNFPATGGFNSACRFTLTEPGTVSKLTAYYKGTEPLHVAGLVRGSIYASSGTVPTTLLAVTTEVNVPASDGWIDFPFATPVGLAPGDYFLCVNSGDRKMGALWTTGVNRFCSGNFAQPQLETWASQGGDASSPSQKAIYATYTVSTFGKSDLVDIESYGNFPGPADANSASQFTLSEAGAVYMLTVYYQGTSTSPLHAAGLVRGSIYSTVGGLPSALLGVTTEVQVPATDGWIVFPFATPVALAAGDYFLCVNSALRKVGAMLTAGVNRYCDGDFALPQITTWGSQGDDASSTFQKAIYATYLPDVVVVGEALSVQIFSWSALSPIDQPTALMRAIADETFHLEDVSPVRALVGNVLSVSVAESLHLSEAATVYGDNTVHVSSGDSIQAAINAALPGTTITLDAGGTYAGPITITKQLTLTTLGWNHAGRVTMAEKTQMGQITMTTGNIVLETVGATATNVIIRGVFIGGSGGDIINFGQGDSSQTSLAQAPSYCTLDQCIVEGLSGTGRRGVGLHCSYGTVTRCHIWNIYRVGIDSTGVGGWNGPGPFTITNNFIEAASECILFGGAEPPIAQLIPADILIDGNTLSKNAAWEGTTISTKNMVELKTGRRVTISNNIMSRQWEGGQAYAIVLTPSQYTAEPWQQVADVLIERNVIGPTCGGMNLFGHGQNQSTRPTLVSENITLRDNWIQLDLALGGQAWLMMLSAGPKNVVIEYNTVEISGSQMWCVGNSNNEGGFPTGHVFRGNLIHNYGTYGTSLRWTNPETGIPSNYLRAEHFFDYFPGAVCEDNAFIGTATGLAARLPGNLHGNPTTYPDTLVVDGYGTGTLAGYGRRP